MHGSNSPLLKRVGFEVICKAFFKPDHPVLFLSVSIPALAATPPSSICRLAPRTPHAMVARFTFGREKQRGPAAAMARDDAAEAA